MLSALNNTGLAQLLCKSITVHLYVVGIRKKDPVIRYIGLGCWLTSAEEKAGMHKVWLSRQRMEAMKHGLHSSQFSFNHM